MKSVRITPLVLLAVCLAALTLFSAGCKKDTGWKSQSAANESAGTTSTTGSSIASPSVSGSSEKPKSVGVSSFLHDLFGTELPKDTDRYQLPKVEETKEYKVDESIHYADVYGNSMYFIRQGEHYVYACVCQPFCAEKGRVKMQKSGQRNC